MHIQMRAMVVWDVCLTNVRHTRKNPMAGKIKCIDKRLYRVDDTCIMQNIIITVLKYWGKGGWNVLVLW